MSTRSKTRGFHLRHAEARYGVPTGRQREEGGALALTFPRVRPTIRLRFTLIGVVVEGPDGDRGEVRYEDWGASEEFWAAVEALMG